MKTPDQIERRIKSLKTTKEEFELEPINNIKEIAILNIRINALEWVLNKQ